jgi:predicted ATP-grasp superfamily ATP-dependent carboligase
VDVNVLVTRASAAAIRTVVTSLTRQGLKVFCADYLPRTMAAYSRHCRGFDLYADPYYQPEGFIESLLGIIRRRRIDVLLPVYDELYVIAKYRDRFPADLVLHTPSWEQIIAVHDKYRLHQLATKLGVPSPATFCPGQDGSVEEIAARMELPVVVKPALGRGAQGISYPATPGELLARFQGPGQGDGRLLVQERLRGQNYGCGVLAQEGRVKLCHTYRVLHCFPPGGGTPTYREGVPGDEIAHYMARLVEHLGWTGIIQGGFIRSERDGKPYLLDINPRVWDSLIQAVASGLDFPYLYFRLVCGEHIPPQQDHGPGVRTLWVWKDLKRLRDLRRAGEIGRLGSLRQIAAALWRASAYDDLSLADPLPFVMVPVIKLLGKRSATPAWQPEEQPEEAPGGSR